MSRINNALSQSQSTALKSVRLSSTNVKININNECLLILSEKEVLFTSEEEIIIFQSWRDSQEQNGDSVFDGLDLFSDGLKHHLLQQQHHLTPSCLLSRWKCF